MDVLTYNSAVNLGKRVPLGSIIEAIGDPGDRFLPADGSSILRSEYTALDNLYPGNARNITSLDKTHPNNSFGFKSGVYVGNDTIIYLGSVMSDIWKSTDNGITWAFVSTLPGDGAGGQLYYFKNKLYCVKKNVFGVFLVSNDLGETWTEITASGYSSYTGGFSIAGDYVFTKNGPGTGIIKSLDFETWTSVQTPVDDSIPGTGEVIYAFDKYIITMTKSDYSTDYLASSTDLVTWDILDYPNGLPVGGTYNFKAYGNGMLVIIDSAATSPNTGQVIVTKDLATWGIYALPSCLRKEIYFDNGTFCIWGQSNTWATQGGVVTISADAENWSNVSGVLPNIYNIGLFRIQGNSVSLFFPSYVGGPARNDYKVVSIQEASVFIKLPDSPGKYVLVK